MSRVSASGALTAKPELDLLRGLPAVLDLGLLASRSSAATQRVQAGARLDDVDQHALVALATLLQQAADVVEFFDSEGKSGSYPSGAFADSVDVAVDALLLDSDADSTSSDVSKFMKDLAGEIASFAGTGDEQAAAKLAPVFTHLTDLLLQKTGRVGETISRL